MIDLKKIKEQPDFYKQGISKKNCNVDIDALLDLSTQHLSIQSETEQLKAKLNKVNKEIGQMKKNKLDASPKIKEMQETSKTIKSMNLKVQDFQEKIHFIMITIPNIPHETVQEGGEKDYQLIRSWGDKPQFDFDIKPHWDIAEQLDCVDFKRGAKISGSGFLLYKNQGAKLERALINYFLDQHTNHNGFLEASPPFLVNEQSMFGTGQLPKMKDDMYHLIDDHLYLIPTAEVPVTNIFNNEIFEAEDLPKKFVAYSPCFRREAGSYGKETRGMVRIHQFDKVEMVVWDKPENSYNQLETMVGYAEKILQDLKLPYRVIQLAAGDISFAAAKAYDLEVWAAGMDKYLEVSSVSNFEDFQARRAKIRYRPQKGAKASFLHTLNGSGLALPRTFVAILENYQQPDGRVKVPDVLVPYMNGLEYIG